MRSKHPKEVNGKISEGESAQLHNYLSLTNRQEKTFKKAHKQLLTWPHTCTRINKPTQRKSSTLVEWLECSRGEEVPECTAKPGSVDVPGDLFSPRLRERFIVECWISGLSSTSSVLSDTPPGLTEEPGGLNPSR